MRSEKYQLWQIVWAAAVILGFLVTAFWTNFASAFGGWSIWSLLPLAIWLGLSLGAYFIGKRISETTAASRRRAFLIAYTAILCLIFLRLAFEAWLISFDFFLTQ